jgi:hypothetical protein
MTIDTKRKKKFDKQVAEFKQYSKRQERKDYFLKVIGIIISLTATFWDTIAQDLQMQYSQGVSVPQAAAIGFGIILFLLGLI